MTRPKRNYGPRYDRARLPNAPRETVLKGERWDSNERRVGADELSARQNEIGCFGYALLALLVINILSVPVILTYALLTAD